VAGDLSEAETATDAAALADEATRLLSDDPARARDLAGDALRLARAARALVFLAIVVPDRESRAVIVTVSPTVEATRRIRRLHAVHRNRVEPTAAGTVPACPRSSACSASRASCRRSSRRRCSSSWGRRRAAT
jgi:hypothetical protein